MLFALFVVLMLFWGLGMVASYTLGGVIHLLLIAALISVIFHFFPRRRVA